MAAQPKGTTLITPTLQATFWEPAELLPALVIAQQKLVAANHDINLLTETNLRLRQEAKSLARKEACAWHSAYHDELTGLPNRRLLWDRLSQAMTQAIRQNKQVVLLFFDIDRFKSINDRMGHSTGDTILRQVADRLATCLRRSDTACRYGGDEFIVMLPEIDGQESVVAVERKVRARLAESYLIDGSEITMSISVGNAVYPVDAQNRSELLKHADHAMYAAKNSAGGCSVTRR